MLRILSSAFFSLSLLAPPAFAEADHAQGHTHEKMTQEAASAAAVTKRDALVKAGKLASNWSGVAVKSVDQKSFSKGPEWVVTFENEAASDPAKRTLYMFYDMNGHFLAANFTGN